MIPHPIVSRSVSRAISAETTVEERASMPCLRHHGYASASQIVSMPALVHHPRRLEHLLERLHGELHDADPERWRHDCARQESSVVCVGPSGSVA